jgi:Family of unknown function (DUF5706)
MPLSSPPEPLVSKTSRSGTESNETATLAPIPVTPAPAELDDAAKQVFLWHVHDYLGEYARFADTKAAFAGALAGALLGALYSASLFTPLFLTSYRQWPLATWLASFAGIALVGTIVLTIATVYPRLRAVPGQGFVFWRNITAFKNNDTFRTSFDSQSAHTLNEHLLNQNFAVAKYVCTPKYRRVSYGLILLATGAIIAASALLAKDRAAALSHSAYPSVVSGDSANR